MKPAVFLAAALAASLARGADRTWIGTIGDSMCGTAHAMEHGGNTATDADCVVSCVGNGERYVLVTAGKTWEFANPDFAGLPAAAGAEVTVAGREENGRIRVTALEPRKTGRSAR